MATSDETATYIGDLPASPTIPADNSQGGRSKGGAELRKNKQIMRDTFEGFTGKAVTATEDELNYCDGVTSNIQTQLNGKSADGHGHTVSEISDLTATAAELNVLDGIAAVDTDLTDVSSNDDTLASAKAIAALVSSQSVIKQIAYGSFSDDNTAGAALEDLLQVTFANAVQAGSNVLAIANVNYVGYANSVNAAFDITDSSDVSILPGGETISCHLSTVYVPIYQSLVAFGEDTSPSAGTGVFYKLRQSGSTSVVATNGSLILVEYANNDA